MVALLPSYKLLGETVSFTWVICYYHIYSILLGGTLLITMNCFAWHITQFHETNDQAFQNTVVKTRDILLYLL